VEVPIGKRIFLDRSISKYSWFDVRYNNRGGFDFDDEWDRIYGLETGKEYIMTADGPKKVESLDPDALKRGEYKEMEWDHEKGNYKKEPGPGNTKDSSGGYRYRNEGNDNENKKDTPATKASTSVYKGKHDETAEVTASSGSTAMSASLTSIMQYFL
jgi:hypothetical protein